MKGSVLERPWAFWAVLAITFVLGLATIKLGFYTDDHAIRAGLEKTWPNGPAAWDLYRFTYGSVEANRAEIEVSALPWWTAPTLKLHLLRPLSCLTYLFDAKVFGWGSSVGWHLHSVAWYLALVYLVGRLLSALMPRATATLAMFLYAMSAAHIFPFAWIAARHMVISGVFGLLGLLALITKDRPWLFALGLAASLAAGETGVGIAVFGLVWIVLKREGLVRRAAPVAAVLVLWFAAYVALGGGASHSDGYVDPASAPLRFAVKSVSMLPVMIANAIFGVPAEFVHVAPIAGLIALGLLASLFVAAMWRGVRSVLANNEREALPWLVGAAVLALLPSLGGFPGARLLLVPNLGFAALLAVLIRYGFAKVHIARSIGAGFLVLVHIVAAPFLMLANIGFNTEVERKLEALVTSADTDYSLDTRLFVVGVSDPMVTMYPPVMFVSKNRLRCWSVISGSKQPHELRRVSEREILVRGTNGRMLDGPFESLYRSKSDPFNAGDEVRQCGAVYRIESVSEGRPTELRVTFDVPLEDKSLKIVLWNGERVVPFNVPNVGATAPIPWSPGPLGMF